MKTIPKIPGYKLIKEIGKGATSIVYLAIQEESKRNVAVKILMQKPLLMDSNYLVRFKKEARIAANLVAHPNIVNVIDMGQTDDYSYFTMEYLEGSLRDRLNRSAGLPIAEITRIIKQIAGALDFAHSKGIVHRDIKPENILFRENGAPVVADFGFAFNVNESTILTEYGMIIGTFSYMSPEQCKGKRGEQASDIYSLGVVFFEMLAGRPPYRAENSAGLLWLHVNAPVPALPDIYKNYQPLIDRMMAKKAKDRIQSGKKIIELIDDLDRRRTTENKNVYPVKFQDKGEKRKKSLHALLVTLIVACCVVVFLIFFLLNENRWPWNKASDENVNGRQMIEIQGGNIRFIPPGGQCTEKTRVYLEIDEPFKTSKGDTVDSDIYYTLDGSEPTKWSGKKYEKWIDLSQNGEYTIATRLISRIGSDMGPVKSQKYTINIPHPPQVEVVGGLIRFSVLSGENKSPLLIKLEFETLKFSDGKVIESEVYYTINGSDPTRESGTKYESGGIISLEKEGKNTIKARVISKNGEYKGLIYSQKFTIQGTPQIETIEQLDQTTRDNIWDNTKRIVIEVEGIAKVEKKEDPKMLLSISSDGSAKVEEISGIEVEPKEKIIDVKEALSLKINILKFLPPTSNGKSVKVKIWIFFKRLVKYQNKFCFEG